MIKQALKIYNRVFDDSRWAWFLLPIAIINCILSYIDMCKEWSIFKNVINSNDKFTEALMTLGFKRSGKYSLRAEYDTDIEMTDEEIHKIANSQIAMIVQKYIEDEMLLGIIKVDIAKIHGPAIIATLRPSANGMFLLDIKNLIISTLFTSILLIVVLLIYNIIF